MHYQGDFVFVADRGWWHGSCWDRMKVKRRFDTEESPFTGNPFLALPVEEQQGYDEPAELLEDPEAVRVDYEDFIHWRNNLRELDSQEIEAFRCRGCNKVISTARS